MNCSFVLEPISDPGLDQLPLARRVQAASAWITDRTRVNNPSRIVLPFLLWLELEMTRADLGSSWEEFVEFLDKCRAISRSGAGWRDVEFRRGPKNQRIKLKPEEKRAFMLGRPDPKKGKRKGLRHWYVLTPRKVAKRDRLV